VYYNFSIALSCFRNQQHSTKHVKQQQSIKNDKKCTLSVTNSAVRTNYPGVAQTDPKRPTYHKVGELKMFRLEF